MTELKNDTPLRVGDTRRTAEGLLVRIICIDRRHPTHPVVGLADFGNGQEQVLFFQKSGRSYPFANHVLGLVKQS